MWWQQKVFLEGCFQRYGGLQQVNAEKNQQVKKDI